MLSVVEVYIVLVRLGMRLSPNTDRVAPAETRWMKVPCCGVVEDVLLPCLELVVTSLGPDGGAPWVVVDVVAAVAEGAAGVVEGAEAVVEGAGAAVELVDPVVDVLAAVVDFPRLQNGHGIEIPLG